VSVCGVVLLASKLRTVASPTSARWARLPSGTSMHRFMPACKQLMLTERAGAHDSQATQDGAEAGPAIAARYALGSSGSGIVLGASPSRLPLSVTIFRRGG